MMIKNYFKLAYTEKLGLKLFVCTGLLCSSFFMQLFPKIRKYEWMRDSDEKIHFYTYTPHLQKPKLF
jgi:hypothetical protein